MSMFRIEAADIFPALENPIPGGKVVTRRTLSGRYRTAIHGGPLNGDTFDYDSAIDAETGHYGTIQLCRQAHLEQERQRLERLRQSALQV